MEVQVVDEAGHLVWSHGQDEQGHRSGMTSSSYPNDGTLPKVINALELAHKQATAELSGPNDVDRVADCSASAG